MLEHCYLKQMPQNFFLLLIIKKIEFIQVLISANLNKELKFYQCQAKILKTIIVVQFIIIVITSIHNIQSYWYSRVYMKQTMNRLYCFMICRLFYVRQYHSSIDYGLRQEEKQQLKKQINIVSFYFYFQINFFSFLKKMFYSKFFFKFRLRYFDKYFSIFQIIKKDFNKDIYIIYKMNIYKAIYMFSTVHSKICIIGGGTGGLNISAKLIRKLCNPSEIRIFEPSKLHYYQPSFTMIGGNQCKDQIAVRKMSDVIPKNIPITHSAVKLINPETNTITTQSNQTFTYNQLIISTGIKNDFDKIKGSIEALNDPHCPVGSIYNYQYAKKVRKLGSSFTGNKAIFIEPELPIKCAGAPQKILYLWTSKWQSQGLRPQISFYKHVDTMFGVPKYAAALTKIAEKYGIKTNFKRKLVEIKKNQRIAVFLNLATNQIQQVKFDFLHVVPPMSPHSFIKQSGLGDPKGFVDVNKFTMQHNKYKNIWSLGDCSNLPCSKTAAAIFSQTDVFMKNFQQVLNNNKTPTEQYDGYSSCPIFVGHKKLMLAEFKYDGVISETFLKDQSVPNRLFYHLKRDFFPSVYWNLVPRGLWSGKQGIKNLW